MLGLLRAGVIRPRLTVSQPNDPYELEAERVAEAVVRMPMPTAAQPRAPVTPSVHPEAQPLLRSLGAGQPLPSSERAFFEPRFSRDFSAVRVHTDERAAQSANAVSAQAYAVGSNIVFGAAGRYAPGGAPAGRQLLAHELAHVVQQGEVQSSLTAKRDSSPLIRRGGAVAVLQRQVSPTVCSPGKMVSVNVDTYRARGMLLKASGKLSAYAASFGLWPASVQTAMGRHFGTTLPPFAGVLAVSAVSMAALTQALSLATAYVCRSTGGYPCSSPSTLAWAPWCLPGPIVLCDPSYFSETPIGRSATLIHEWTHKFWCRLDIGYEHEPGYPQNLFTASLNADNFANLVRDLQ